MTALESDEQLSFHELDDTGNVTATYVYSTTAAVDGKRGRVDMIPPPCQKTKSYARNILDAFLPAGFPDSVTEDYLSYQVYDSLQAFASSIASLLSSRAVLSSVGVGDANARPQDALLLSIIQESLGRVATILFAHRFGTAIEPECKMYRLLADVFNDVSIILDCLSPVFPSTVRVGVLAGSSVLRALTGVCAGSAKGCLSAHFARAGNLGELNAKDSSQETVVSLAGMLVGTLVVAHVTSTLATWSALMLLLSIHLAMNHAAVQAVCMRSVNRQRCNILMSTLVERGIVLSPKEVSQKERVFERDGVLRWCDGRKVGYCRMGCSVSEVMHLFARRQHHHTSSPATTSYDDLALDLSRLVSIFRDEMYVVVLDVRQRTAMILLKEGATPLDQIKAWTYSLIIAKKMHDKNNNHNHNRGQGDNSAMEEVSALTTLSQRLRREELVRSGWDLDLGAMETTTVRIRIGGVL